MNHVYTFSYPLVVLRPFKLKMGEILLVVRFSSSSLIDTLCTYSQPLLPKMHYFSPLPVFELDGQGECEQGWLLIVLLHTGMNNIVGLFMTWLHWKWIVFIHYLIYPTRHLYLACENLCSAWIGHPGFRLARVSAWGSGSSRFLWRSID